MYGCGKSEILNGERLTVHHIDADKMQGCNGKNYHTDHPESKMLILIGLDGQL